MDRSKLLIVVVASIGLSFAVGCSRGPARGGVSGTVTLDGKPLGGVIVVFHPLEHQAPLARGTSTETGTFVLEADDGGNGVVVGNYRVVVLDPQAIAGALISRQNAGQTAGRVPPRYQSWDQTPLEIEVESENAEVEVPLQTVDG